MKIKLSELKQDLELLKLRGINLVTLKQYIANLKLGEKFPPLIIDQDNVIVSGNHRFAAYKKVYEGSHKVTVIKKTYDSEVDRLAEFITENNTHGLPLTPWDKKMIYSRLIELNVDADTISKLILSTPERVSTIGGQLVYVQDEDGSTSQKPLKHSMVHLAGTTMTSEAYHEHSEKVSGLPLTFHCNQIRMFLENNWENTDDERFITSLERLYTAIGGYLGR